MKNDKQVKKYQKAEKDYNSGMSIRDIAFKYSVKEDTVKKWKTRHKWKCNSVPNKTKLVINGMSLEEIKNELIDQLEKLGKKNIQNIIEVEAYIDAIEDYYEYKHDLKERGYMIEWENGSQSGVKKNESAELKLRMSAERRKIIVHLGLDSIIEVKENEDEAL